MSHKDRLVIFFSKNPHTIGPAREIAIKNGKPVTSSFRVALNSLAAEKVIRKRNQGGKLVYGPAVI